MTRLDSRAYSSVWKNNNIIIMILVLLPGARGSLCLVRTVAKVADYSGCVQPDSGARQISHRPASGAEGGRQGQVTEGSYQLLLFLTF